MSYAPRPREYWVFHPCTGKKHSSCPFPSPRLLAHCAGSRCGFCCDGGRLIRGRGAFPCRLPAHSETAKRIISYEILWLQVYIVKQVQIDLDYIQSGFWSQVMHFHSVHKVFRRPQKLGDLTCQPPQLARGKGRRYPCRC